MKLSRQVLIKNGAGTIDKLVDEEDKVSASAGALAGLAVPSVAITATGYVTGLSGGAAIMKTLAITGTVVGGGAVAGVTVIGIGSVFAAWGTTKAIKKYRINKKKNR